MNWTCPYCNRAQTVVEKRYSQDDFLFYIGDVATGQVGIQGWAIGCANPDCQKPTIGVHVAEAKVDQRGMRRAKGRVILSQQLLPEHNGKPQPDYIPAPLREDYLEACRIVELSPKASATLARRCLQGMIRDFCGISKGRLIDEIKRLKELVEEGDAPKGVSDDSVEAIDAVRQIGNIGAHMEKDINLIIDVDPDESRTLIELVETLFDEWYVEREKRQARFGKIKEIAEAKNKQKKVSQEKPKQIEGPDE
ncbi:MAG: DUF4145 domain-containing protein [Rhodobacteraceae bacterium]|nr:DUF4145 domain-containing protein [Paracoccaceae bacterium]